MSGKVIASYHNGNLAVTIYSDGTKIREHEGEPRPEFPESMDLKITDYCDLGCAWCHEDSLESGLHCNQEEALRYVHDLPAGVELAIGGGNPLAHPDLETFLANASARGLICNITVNQGHLERFYGTLERLISRGYIHGLGISGSRPQPALYDLTGNVVHHLIAGVHGVDHVAGLPKVLVLGYKEFRRGADFLSPEVVERKREWFNRIPELFGKTQLSFDNLAIKQLRLERFFTREEWSKFYMGDDGEYTMYVDAVKGRFATSSTSEKTLPWTDAVNDFQSIRS